MLLLGEKDFAASGHDSFDANSLVMVTLRQATSISRTRSWLPVDTSPRAIQRFYVFHVLGFSRTGFAATQIVRAGPHRGRLRGYRVLGPPREQTQESLSLAQQTGV